jgi:biopolymer transport protein ExbD
MPLKAAALEEPQMNLTPMLDVVFNLIIFFMVGTRFADMERQFDVNLPKVSDAQPLTSLPDEIIVNVYGDGRIRVGKQTLSLEELATDLRAARDRYADQAVLVRGEGEGPYQIVMDVLSVCQQAGITNTALATQIKSEGAR